MAHTHARLRTSAKPSRISPQKEPDASASSSGPRVRSRTPCRSAAANRNVPASTANADPAPTPRTRAVASAGPANSATHDETAIIAFASWISGSGTVWGRSAVPAGRANASAHPNTASIAAIVHTSGLPAKMSAASNPCNAKRARFVAIISLSRGSRSAHTPPTGARSTNGSACAVSTNPTSVALPVSWITYSAMPTVMIPSPMSLSDCPIQNRRKSRWRRALHRCRSEVILASVRP